MKSWKKIFITLALVFVIVFCVQAQVSFVIQVSDNPIGRKDMVSVSYTLKNAQDMGNMLTPDFEGWRVVSGPQISQQSVSINGKNTNSISYTFLLQPQHSGTLTVPGISVVADGKTISCNPQKITVLTKDNVASQNKNTQQQQPTSIFDLFGDNEPQPDITTSLPNGVSPKTFMQNNIFVRAEAEKTNCYVGEPVLVTFKLYSALVTESRITKQPAFTGCSILELTQEERPGIENYKGKNFRTFLIRRVLVTPLQAGDINLGQAIVENNVALAPPNNPYVTQNYAYTASSPALILHASLLPEQGKPADFSGAIGKFQITAKLNKSSLPAEENNNLHIEISGVGNLSAVTKPEIQWGSAIQSFDGTDSQYMDKSNYPVISTKSYDIPFIGNSEGNIDIPPISFTYFDIESKKYKTIKTNNLSILFTKALSNNNPVNTPNENLSNKKYLWIVAAIAFLVMMGWLFSELKGRKAKKTSQQHSETVAEPTAATGEQPVSEETKAEETKPETDFSSAFQDLAYADNKQFFVLSKALLIQALQEHLHTQETNENTLLDKLKNNSKNINNELVEKCNSIFNICNKAIYAPMLNTTERFDIFQKLELVIQLIGSK
ncbi:MAG: BatD family protein [Chitinophagaceae bacterium]|jgi:hypothetical protein|nr:BatD family protein [Chitinophagaceae bacterium]